MVERESLTSKNRVVCYSVFYVSFVSWQRSWARSTVDRWAVIGILTSSRDYVVKVGGLARVSASVVEARC